MDVYRSGSAVSATISLIDSFGISIVAASVDYRVVDESGVELKAIAATGFAAGDTVVTIAVSGLLNQLAVDKLKGLRILELKITDDLGSVIYLSHEYAIEVETGLVMMVNSYQTLNQAKLLTLDMPDQIAWMSANDRRKQAALIEAFERIGKLRFNIYDSNFPSRDNLIYPAASHLNSLTSVEFAQLPTLFTNAVLKAQIIEADVILGGDPISKKREEGLMSNSVGESSVMFRPGKPLITAVSKRALDQLSGWVTFSIQIGRT